MAHDLTTIHGSGRIAVFYLHGGGLLYGERDDLPARWVDMLCGAGYELICADYPLAPECALPQIVESVMETWRESVGERLDAGELDGYFLFGRSAGGHLALMLAREIERRGGTRPLGILDFYGYPGLVDPSFSEPTAAYAKLPSVDADQVARIAGGETVTSGPKALRYALYVRARQVPGEWLRLMGLDGSAPERTPEAWSLTAQDIAALPPLFACGSTADEDVPYGVGKRFARSCPKAVFKTVYDLPHDFDRDTSCEAAKIYEEALAWMAKQLP